MNRYAPAILGAVLAGIIAGAPLAASAQKPSLIVWGALAAGASYLKGKLEQTP